MSNSSTRTTGPAPVQDASLDGRFRRVRALGAGGMGVAFEGRMTFAGGRERPCVIKLMKHEHLHRESRVDLFEREGMLGWEVTHDHPNLVTTYELGEWNDGQLFVAMELIEGPDLSQIAGRVRGDAEVLRRIAHDALSALSYLHAQGVLHRDVSFRNMLLSRTGVVKLADFGLAHRVEEAHSVGRRGVVAWASREVLMGEGATPLSDVYSLGAVLYELITGTAPYGSTLGGVLGRMHRGHAPSLPPDTAPDLLRLVTKLIRPAPADRLSAAEALALLENRGATMAGDARMAAIAAAWCEQEQALWRVKPAEAPAPEGVREAAPRSAQAGAPKGALVVAPEPAQAAPLRPAPEQRHTRPIAAGAPGRAVIAAMAQHNKAWRRTIWRRAAVALTLLGAVVVGYHQHNEPAGRDTTAQESVEALADKHQREPTADSLSAIKPGSEQVPGRHVGPAAIIRVPDRPGPVLPAEVEAAPRQRMEMHRYPYPATRQPLPPQTPKSFETFSHHTSTPVLPQSR